MSNDYFYMALIGIFVVILIVVIYWWYIGYAMKKNIELANINVPIASMEQGIEHIKSSTDEKYYGINTSGALHSIEYPYTKWVLSEPGMGGITKLKSANSSRLSLIWHPKQGETTYCDLPCGGKNQYYREIAGVNTPWF
jgi:hypothetical protein